VKVVNNEALSAAETAKVVPPAERFETLFQAHV
jgi:hypothetical protein